MFMYCLINDWLGAVIMSGFDWVEISPTQFKQYMLTRPLLVCSCKLFFYYGTGKVPELKMDRYKAKYYVEHSVIHRE